MPATAKWTVTRLANGRELRHVDANPHTGRSVPDQRVLTRPGLLVVINHIAPEPVTDVRRDVR